MSTPDNPHRSSASRDTARGAAPSVPGAEADAEAGAEEAAGRWLTPGVAGVGAASFFSDAGHEIATAVLPSFLAATLHASAGALGIIEGVSDALVGVMKLVGGPLANDPERRGRIASGGYLGTALATGAIGLATTVWQVGVLRAFAWCSRGLRSPARDALLASVAPKRAYGRAFGLERAGDNLGAVAGPLLAAGLVGWVGIRHAIWFAVVPGSLAAVAITVAARQARQQVSGGAAGETTRRLRFDLARLREAGLLGPLLPIAMFEFGNVATTLLILRATQLLAHGGRSLTAAASLAILVYAAHNAAASLVALAGGHWIDRAGPRVVFGSGALLYLLAYGGFAASWHAWPALLSCMVLAGAGIGLAETAESALVAQMVPDRLRGSGFGLLGGAQSFGDFASSAVVGLLYAAVSAAAGFAYAAGWMLLSLAMLLAARGIRSPSRDRAA
jgi:MFS family permease